MSKSQTLPLCAQVDGRVQSLLELYDGPQPSDVCELLEGEQFFAGFERGLDISTGLQLCFRPQKCFVSSCCSQPAGVLQRDQTVWREDSASRFTPA